MAKVYQFNSIITTVLNQTVDFESIVCRPCDLYLINYKSVNRAERLHEVNEI